jgi:hypothetical protein
MLYVAVELNSQRTEKLIANNSENNSIYGSHFQVLLIKTRPNGIRRKVTTCLTHHNLKIKQLNCIKYFAVNKSFVDLISKKLKIWEAETGRLFPLI